MGQSNLVAVYGSLRNGLGNHRMLTTAEPYGDDVTEKEWQMFSLGAYPGIIPGGESINIEVYKVNDLVFNSLDRLEGYPSFYNRRIINTKFGDAWIYFLNRPSYISDNKHFKHVEGGDWVDFIENKERF